MPKKDVAKKIPLPSSAPPTLRRQPQQQRSQARVEKILQAAAAVFWEEGYDAATTHAIAAKSNTAVGTLYRFFPNKLAIFHALEKQHRQGVEDIHAQLMSPEFVQQPLPKMIRQSVETYAAYFQNLGPRVVYTQYYTSPELYAQFDDAVDYSYIRRFAILLRMRNAQLTINKSELIAEVAHRTFNAIFLSALKSEPTHQKQLYQELQTLLTNYLSTYDTPTYDISCRKSEDNPPQQTAPLPLPSSLTSALNPRQRKALAYLEAHGQLTIQTFEILCPSPSRRTLQRDLKQLVTQGLLKTAGETNQLSYVLE